MFTAPSSHRNGRLSMFGVKTGACEYGSIEVVERRCLGWDSGVVKGLKCYGLSLKSDGYDGRSWEIAPDTV